MHIPDHQYSLTLIERRVENSIIEQRASDGYINATNLCKAAGRLFGHYRENAQTREFLEALEADIGIPISDLVQTVRGGAGQQGTWVHPQVAIHLGQWLSARFAVQVSKWVHDWMSGKGAPQGPSKLPAHLDRWIANDPKVPTGYFSVLQETGLNLFGPLHNLGFDIPDRWTPDISVGLTFCKWLRSVHNIDTDELPSYRHDYPDGRVVSAKLYPDSLLADFRFWFRTVWLPVHGVRYFKAKDPSSLQYVDRHPALAAPATPIAAPRKRLR